MTGRTVELLTPSAIADLRAQPLTYPAIVRDAASSPPGYAQFTRSHRLDPGADFGEAARALMSWQVQARSGPCVFASSLEVDLGVVVLMRVGLGPVALRIPCRVVKVTDEPDRRGFSYGTLPGHPESGEESFLLERHDDAFITFSVSAFSRPASRLARLGGPITTQAQRLMTRRYLRSLD